MKPDFESFSPFNFLRFTLDHDLALYEDLLALTEKYLADHLNKTSNWIESSGLPDPFDHYYDDLAAARDEIPNIIYGALFTSLFAYIEFRLTELARYKGVITDDKHGVSPRFRDLLDALRKCSINNVQSDVCEELNLLQYLRNAIVHRNGTILPRERSKWHELRDRELFKSIRSDDSSWELKINSRFLIDFVKWCRHALPAIADCLKSTADGRS